MNKFLISLSTLAFCAALFAAAPEPITNRRNVASSLYGSTITATSADGTVTNALPVISGGHTSGSAIYVVGTPSTFEIIFSQPEQINLIRIYPGNLGYAGNPSGECSPRSYKIERWNNGYYLPLVEAKNQPSYAESGTIGDDEFCYEHKFKPIKAEKIRVTITESGHTGRSATSPELVPVEQRPSYIRAIEVYSAKRSDDLAVSFQDCVKGDFTLPVWRNQSEAILKLTCTNLNKLPVHITVRDQVTEEEVYALDTELHRGEQFINFPLKKIRNGRFVVKIVPVDEKSSFKGYVHRMLRVDKQAKAMPPQGTYDVSGMLVYPVDDFHFETLQDVSVKIHQAEPIEISKRMGFGQNYQDSRSSDFMGKDAEGTYYFRFRERGSDGTMHYFISTSKDLKEWKTIPEEQNTFRIPYVKSPFAPVPKPAEKKGRTTIDFAQAKIRKFDKSKDAPFELNDVIVQWFPPYSWDVKSKGLVDWSTYPMIERGDEWLLLTDEPLFVERFDYPGDLLEVDIDCNDNFGTTYLLDDGKTLCYGKAGKVRVFDEMAVLYDNLPEAYRIMRVYYTHDGFNWQYEYFCPPDENDPWGFQSYGYNAWRVDKDFWLAFNFAYDCRKQQIYPEICYSHDGIIWERFEDRTPFVANTPINTWLFGMIFMDLWCPFEDGREWFLPCGVGRCNPHFYPTPALDNPMTADVIKRSFGSRKLAEQWPFFEAVGGWQGLADSINHYAPGNVSGVIRFRKNGYFASRASANGGKLVSRLFSAPNNLLVLNYAGKMTITLLDSNNQPIEGYIAELDGDEVEATITWQNGAQALPTADFKVACQLEPSAEIFCFRFLND